MGNPSSVIQNRRSIHGHFQMSLLPRTDELKQLYKYLQENDELSNDGSSSDESAADVDDTSDGSDGDAID